MPCWPALVWCTVLSPATAAGGDVSWPQPTAALGWWSLVEAWFHSLVLCRGAHSRVHVLWTQQCGHLPCVWRPTGLGQVACRSVRPCPCPVCRQHWIHPEHVLGVWLSYGGPPGRLCQHGDVVECCGVHLRSPSCRSPYWWRDTCALATGNVLLQVTCVSSGRVGNCGTTHVQTAHRVASRSARSTSAPVERQLTWYSYALQGPKALERSVHVFDSVCSNAMPARSTL
jgi:hypothetical protein